MAFTTEQTLLLNNLIYLESGKNSPFQRPDSFEGQTVGDWLNSIDTSRIVEETDYGNFMTGKDWKDIIEAAKQDSTVMNMRIADTHVDLSSDGGEGYSAVFISEETSDALVVFKGTQGSREWVDNFQGGNMADTPIQQNALEWYQQVYQEQGLGNYEVTVSGHSKGGNKAKYVAILDSSVDHCVSFDGQGFSDKFMEKYADEIAARQGSIENHNVDYDFVNFLLNDVGKSTYYKGHDYGDGGFLENHCPNTFMKFAQDGSFSLEVNPDGQAEEIQALDGFLNNILRSMPDSQRSDTLNMIADIWNTATSFNGSSQQELINTLLDMAADPKYSDPLAYLIAYSVEYEQANPELVAEINNLLTQFNMGDFTNYVDMVDGILNFEKTFDLGIFGTYTIDFDLLYDVVNGVAALLPDWAWSWILSWLNDTYGVDLTLEELKNLLNVAGKINTYMDRIELQDNGDDIEITSSASGAGGNCSIRIQITPVQEEALAFQTCANSLRKLAEELRTEAGSGSFQSLVYTLISKKLQTIIQRLYLDGENTQKLSSALSEVAQLYERTEAKNAVQFSAQSV